MKFWLNSFEYTKRQLSRLEVSPVDRYRVGKSWTEPKHVLLGHIEPYWQNWLIAAHMPGDQSG